MALVLFVGGLLFSVCCISGIASAVFESAEKEKALKEKQERYGIPNYYRF